MPCRTKACSGSVTRRFVVTSGNGITLSKQGASCLARLGPGVFEGMSNCRLDSVHPEFGCAGLPRLKQSKFKTQCRTASQELNSYAMCAHPYEHVYMLSSRVHFVSTGLVNAPSCQLRLRESRGVDIPGALQTKTDNESHSPRDMQKIHIQKTREH